MNNQRFHRKCHHMTYYLRYILKTELTHISIQAQTKFGKTLETQQIIKGLPKTQKETGNNNKQNRKKNGKTRQNTNQFIQEPLEPRKSTSKTHKNIQKNIFDAK
jgi:hypothetical protein